MTTYKRKNGKWYCRFQVDGERHHYLCSGANTQKEAEKLENQYKYKIQQQINGVIARDEKSVSLLKLQELYLAHSAINNRGHKNNKYYFKAFISYWGSNKTVQKIKPQDINNFKQELANRGLANSSINRYLHVLSKMFNLGIQNKLLKENPVFAAGQLPEKNYKIRFLTLEEENRLFKVLQTTSKHLYPIIVCALQTGMRRGEILTLKWENIDFDFGFIELLETKSNKSRKIPISEKLRSILQQQHKTSDYVFINPKTQKPYTEFKHSWNSLVKQANIANLRFHDLRHTVATRLVEKGIDLIVVKEILGHADISTTMRYAHAVPKRKLEAIEVLNSYN